MLKALHLFKASPSASRIGGISGVHHCTQAFEQCLENSAWIPVDESHPFIPPPCHDPYGMWKIPTKNHGFVERGCIVWTGDGIILEIDIWEIPVIDKLWTTMRWLLGVPWIITWLTAINCCKKPIYCEEYTRFTTQSQYMYIYIYSVIAILLIHQWLHIIRVAPMARYRMSFRNKKSDHHLPTLDWGNPDVRQVIG